MTTAEMTKTQTATLFAGEFSRVLDTATRAAGASGLMDWTNKVKIEADGKRVTVSCTDLVCHIQATCHTIGPVEPFAVLVDASRLKGLVATFPAEAQVTLTVADDRLVVKCLKTVNRFPVSNPEVFPLLSEKATTTITADAERWTKAVDYTSWAAARAGDARATLTGVIFRAFPETDAAGAGMIVSATDGNAAAVWHGFGANGCKVSIPDDTYVSVEFALPAAALAKIAGLLRRVEGEVTCDLAGRDIAKPGMAIWSVVDSDGEARTTIAVRVNEGPWPAIPDLLDNVEKQPLDSTGATFLVDPFSVATALKRTMLMTQSTAKGYTPVDLRVGSENVAMHGAGQQTGEGTDEFQADVSQGSGTYTRINATYLDGAMDACRSAGGDVGVRYATRNSPIVFTPDLDDTLSVLVMPMGDDAAVTE
jgi:DNA polymerase III sliding clamp (beta) subunit (PCNA family)